MPVPGDEESRVIVRQSNSCSAGIPIKKRRFPLVRSPSPPTQEPSSLDVGNASEESRNLLQRPLLLNDNSAVNTFGGPDSSCISFSEIKKTNVAEANVALTGINISGGKVQDPSNTIQSGTIDKVETKEKQVQTDKTASVVKQGSSELDLVPTEALVNMKAEMHNKQVEENYNLEVSKSRENTDSSLACKEPLTPALEHQDNEGSSQVANYLEDSSLLSLSSIQGKSVIQRKSANHMVNSGNTRVSTNRSNWDLNTTMDVWEGSLRDASLQGTVNFGQSDETSGSNASQTSTSLSGKLVFGMGENRSTSPSPHLHLRQHHKSEDSLHLSLGLSSHQPKFTKEQSGLLARVDSDRVVRSSDYHGVLSSTANTGGHRIIKSEPVDDNTKRDFVGARCCPMGLSDSRNVKQEVVERSVQEAVKAFNESPQKSVEHRSMKSEPFQEFHQDVHCAFEITSNQSVGPVTQSQDNCSSTSVMSVTPTKTSSLILLTNLEFSASGNVSNQSDHSGYSNEFHVNKLTPAEGSVEKSTAQTIPTDVSNESKELNASIRMTNSCSASDVDNSNDETCKSQLTDEVPLNSHANCDGSPSDEEKVNISIDMVEDAYGSDYESDGNHDVPTAMFKEDRQCGKNDDEYEDGEVREPLIHPAVEGLVCNGREEENINADDRDARNLVSSGVPSEGERSRSQAAAAENGKRTKDHGETSDDHVKECFETIYVEKNTQCVEKILSSEEPLSVEMVISETDEKRVIKAAQSKPYQLGGKDIQLAHEKEISNDGAIDGSQGTVRTVDQTADENVKGAELVDKAELVITKAETSANSEHAAKDANCSGRSRIINLCRAPNVTSPCRNRPIGGRSFMSRTGRERYTDYEQGRLHVRGTRAEIYSDVPQNFVRERIHDQSFRNNRMTFMRGRRRESSRLDTLRSEWDGGHDFAPDMCNGPVNYRFPRSRPTSDATDSDVEYNDYVMSRDERAVRGRGGRNNLNEELPSFHHLSSRRLSLRSRDGPATRGFQMVRRISRNISPGGSTGEHGSGFVGLRHGEKFMSGLPDDVMGPIFSRAQNYERLDGQFVRGNRNFSSVQRRGDPRIRSKSPVRSRTSSPGPWLSTRRRSPDGFCGLPELAQHRSPVINRMGRQRSTDRPCFPEEIVSRRRGSPPYIGRQSNDLRDIGTDGDHSHPRSAIHKRGSPSERILSRNTRRFDVLDPRERTETNEYFGRPDRSGRLHELHADDIDERRNYGGGRGVVRPLRPPYRGTDGQNLRFHLDNGPKPVRFCSDADSDFIERSNLRESDFDRRIKSRPIVAHRRLRGIGEQEGNYRHSGQAWHDDGLDDDLSRGKRRKF